MPPKHIAFVLTSFARGGMEMRLADIVNGLDKTRWNPHIYAFYDHLTLRDALEDAERLHTPLARFRRDPLLPFTLARIFRQQKTQVAWALTQGLAAGWGRLGAVMGNVPLKVLSLHDVFPIAPLTRALNPITDVIVVNSEFARQHALDSGISSRKIRVLYNGIDTQKYSQGKDRRETLFGIAPHRPVVLHVGRLEPAIKGQDIVLKALAPLMQGDNPPLLVLVGEGIFAQGAGLENLAQDLGILPHVYFAGLQADVPAFMRSADVLVMSSRTESSPNVVLEAQACALPVIVTRVGGAPELLQDGKTGLLIPPDDPSALRDALKTLLEDAPRRQEYAEQGRRWVEARFSLEKMIQGRADLMDEFLERKKA